MEPASEGAAFPFGLPRFSPLPHAIPLTHLALECVFLCTLEPAFDPPSIAVASASVGLSWDSSALMMLQAGDPVSVRKVHSRAPTYPAVGTLGRAAEWAGHCAGRVFSSFHVSRAAAAAGHPRAQRLAASYAALARRHPPQGFGLFYCFFPPRSRPDPALRDAPPRGGAFARVSE